LHAVPQALAEVVAAQRLPVLGETDVLEVGAVASALEPAPVQEVEERPVEEDDEDRDRRGQQREGERDLAGRVAPPATAAGCLRRGARRGGGGRVGGHGRRSVVSGSNTWTCAGSTTSRAVPPGSSRARPVWRTTRGESPIAPKTRHSRPSHSTARTFCSARPSS